VAHRSHEPPLPEGVTRIRAANPGPLTLSGTNTYLTGAPAWVVDPGPPDDDHLERVLAAASERGGVAGIVLTHRHLDHAGAAAALRERTGAALAASAAAPSAAARFAEPGVDSLEVDRLLREGDRVGPFEVVGTPGHAADHVCLLAGRTLFCGDTVLGEGSVFVPPEPGALAAYLRSLRKLQRLSLDALCPGHGPVVWEPAAKLAEYLDHRLDRERRLLDALGNGMRTREQLLDTVWDDVPPVLRPAAALTLAAHLDKLEEEGLLPEGVER
jgi:glyoxylase-like metal-dependent hydrolase (beta-lactamase superfamily II)